MIYKASAYLFNITNNSGYKVTDVYSPYMNAIKSDVKEYFLDHKIVPQGSFLGPNLL